MATTSDVYSKFQTYGYDAGSNRNLLKLSGANYASYGYDDANRLTTLTNSADNAVINFGYDNANKLIQRNYPNGVATTYDYDGMSRLTRLKDAGASVNFDRQYSYNTANQINQIIEPTRTRSFDYDNLDRLTSVSPSTGAPESYSFDAVGNRTASHLSASYGYQPFNRLTSAVGKTFSYDNNGNMTTRNDASGAWKYSWDYENRLKQASVRSGISIAYKYDALGRRIERVPSTGVSTQFTYDGQDVLLDQNSDGTTVKYLNGAGIDNKLRQTSGATVEYFHADHLGSTNALTNASGAITSQTTYDAFGNQSGTLATRYGYTGRERDDATGLMYYRARQYSPDIGRFISEDPSGFAGGDINLFGYVKNKPVNRKDPMGLDDADIAFRNTDYYKSLENQSNEFWKKRALEEYEAGFLPENFQCGPSPSSPWSWFIPQRPRGYNFKDTACYNHDACYGVCGKSKGQCDGDFLDDLEKECNTKGNWLEIQICLTTARPYYWIVGGLGGPAYRDSQQHSKCDECQK